MFATTFRRSAIVAAAGLLSMTALVSGSAAAAPEVPAMAAVTKNLTFSCEFPVVGKREVKTEIAATFPESVRVDAALKVTDFNVGVNIDAATTDALRLVGAASVQGSGAPSVDLNINGTALGVTIPGLDIPSTKVPASGAMSLNIVGEMPELTVRKPGEVSFAVGSAFTGTVTPKKADGSDTELGTFELPCTLNQGQDTSLATVPVR